MVGIPREAAEALVTQHYCRQADGLTVLMRRYPGRVPGLRSQEELVEELVRSLSEAELAAEVARAAEAGWRQVAIPKAVAIMILWRYYVGRMDGLQVLLQRYPGRRKLKGPYETRVLQLLQSLSESELSDEICRVIRPTMAYLEAAGLDPEEAWALHFGREPGNPEARVTRASLQRYIASGILPPQAEALARSWWKVAG